MRAVGQILRPHLSVRTRWFSVNSEGECSSTVLDLTDRFFGSFRQGEKTLWQIGREAEYSVVWADGSAADVKLLLSDVARHEGGFDRLLSSSDTCQLIGLMGHDVEFSLEVGWGTVELITGPHEDLFALQRAHEHGMEMLTNSARCLGMHVLGYGIRPRTAPSENLMSPRGRYRVMRRAIGPAWNMITVTASHQDHVDIWRDEALPTMNWETLMKQCGHQGHRYGMPVGPFHSPAHFFDEFMRLPFLMHPDDSTGMWTQVPAGTSFGAHIRSVLQRPTSHHRRGKSIVTQMRRDFLAHEQYVWHSTRARARQSTLELLSACQQPWPSYMAAAALQTGMVEATASGVLQRVVSEEFGGDLALAWQTMQVWYVEVMATGMGSIDCSGSSSSSIGHATMESKGVLNPQPFLRNVLNACVEGIAQRGRGEEVFMEPLQQRLDAKRNPAQEFVALALCSEGGLHKLIEHTKIS